MAAINGLFLAKKGLSARDIHNEFVAVLGAEVRAYSTITRDRRQHHFAAMSSEPFEEPPMTIIDGAILDALEKQPFSFLHKLAKLMCIPKITVHRNLTSSIGFAVKYRVSRKSFG
jgi:hypothetical protein